MDLLNKGFEKIKSKIVKDELDEAKYLFINPLINLKLIMQIV